MFQFTESNSLSVESLNSYPISAFYMLQALRFCNQLLMLYLGDSYYTFNNQTNKTIKLRSKHNSKNKIQNHQSKANLDDEIQQKGHLNNNSNNEELDTSNNIQNEQAYEQQIIVKQYQIGQSKYMNILNQMEDSQLHFMYQESQSIPMAAYIEQCTYNEKKEQKYRK
ncbi:hypothetical protein ABPG74_019083 [Tetrahymena malaccensis]